MPFLSRLAQYASDLQKHTTIAVITAVLIACAPALAAKISFKARGAKIVLLIIGFLALAWGIALGYIKLDRHAINLPSSALALILGTGIAFLVMCGILWWNQRRAVNRKISDLYDATASQIRMYQQRLGAVPYVEETTTDDESVVLRLTSLVRRTGRGQLVLLVGQLGSGKTATLLKLATDCSRQRPGGGRPLIAIYVDLAEYSVATSETPHLHEFILSQFGEATRKKVKEAWDQAGLNVNWVFVFDNADEAELRRPAGQRSWDFEIGAFINRPSEFAPFHAVIASRTAQAHIDADHVVWIEGLTATGRDRLLAQAQVNPADVAALAVDMSFNQYLANPGTLDLLTPTLARRTWTNSNNVHIAMGDAIDRLARRRLPVPASDANSLLATGRAVVMFLRTRRDTDPDAPCELSEMVAHLASDKHQPQHLIRRDIMELVDCGIAKRITGRGSAKYIEFAPAVAAYLYACALLEDPSRLEVHELLLNSQSRLTVLSLLKVASDELVACFTREAELILDRAINSLSKTQKPLAGMSEQAKPKWSEGTGHAFEALFVLIEGLQDRLELLGEQFRTKAIEFTNLIMPIAPTRVQADLPEASYALGTPEQAMSIMARGLGSGDGTQVLDAASRMVNATSEVTDLDEHQAQLVSVIILVGLRSLTLNRGRDDLPYGLALADSAGSAAIILYGVIFGLAGLLQLTIYWHNPSWQIVEVALALLLVAPMTAARYNSKWCKYVLGKRIRDAMEGTSSFLALCGAVGAVVVIAVDLATFSLSLMPLVVCYSLIWPAGALSYLESDPHPTLASVIFPLPQNIRTLWHTNIAERSSKSRSNR